MNKNFIFAHKSYDNLWIIKWYFTASFLLGMDRSKNLLHSHQGDMVGLVDILLEDTHSIYNLYNNLNQKSRITNKLIS